MRHRCNWEPLEYRAQENSFALLVRVPFGFYFCAVCAWFRKFGKVLKKDSPLTGEHDFGPVCTLVCQQSFSGLWNFWRMVRGQSVLSSFSLVVSSSSGHHCSLWRTRSAARPGWSLFQCLWHSSCWDGRFLVGFLRWGGHSYCLPGAQRLERSQRQHRQSTVQLEVLKGPGGRSQELWEKQVQAYQVQGASVSNDKSFKTAFIIFAPPLPLFIYLVQKSLLKSTVISKGHFIAFWNDTFDVISNIFF